MESKCENKCSCEPKDVKLIKKFCEELALVVEKYREHFSDRILARAAMQELKGFCACITDTYPEFLELILKSALYESNKIFEKIQVLKKECMEEENTSDDCEDEFEKYFQDLKKRIAENMEHLLNIKTKKKVE